VESTHPFLGKPARRPMIENNMQAPSERGRSADLASGAGQDWLGDLVWQVPEVEISKINSWPSITAMSYHRGEGESIWRGDRHRIVVALDQHPACAHASRARSHRLTPPAGQAAKAAISRFTRCPFRCRRRAVGRYRDSHAGSSSTRLGSRSRRVRGASLTAG
jgi:hypothetical protein